MTNKAIVNELKKRLKKANGKQVEELPNVLWAYRTTPRRFIYETPFSFTFRTETVILVEVGLSSMRIANFSPNTNDVIMTK